MKHRNDTLSLPRITTYSNYPPSSDLGRRAEWYVTSSGIVHGDFRSYNPWGYTVHDKYHFTGTKRLQYRIGQMNWWETKGAFGFESDPPFYPDWNRALVYNLALEKLNSKVRGGLDLSIALAEAGTTVRMIKSVKKFTDFARGRGLGSTKDLANGWLQYTYGWKPLMSDIFAVANESVNIVLGTIQRVHARVRLPLTVDAKKRRSQIANLTAATAVTTNVRGDGGQSCTIVLELDVPSFDLARWTSLNPVSIGWELIPYSFVVDWFYDVGSYLRGLETALLYSTRFRSGYVSELYAYDGEEWVKEPLAQDFGSYYYSLDVKASVRRREFVRAVLSSYPFPRKPTFEVDLNWKRLVSAGSLLRQLFK